MCAIGLYELSVLSPGGGVVVIWQSGQILLELRAEWRCAGHTVTTRKETGHFIILKKIMSANLSNKISAVSVERSSTTYR